MSSKKSIELLSTSRKSVLVDSFVPLLRNSDVMRQSIRMEGFLAAQTIKIVMPCKLSISMFLSALLRKRSVHSQKASTSAAKVNLRAW